MDSLMRCCSRLLSMIHILRPMECHRIVNKESGGVVGMGSTTEVLDQGPGAAIPWPGEPSGTP
jgi:hypothetical protein